LTFRPSRLRVAGLAALGSAGAAPVLVDDAPIVVKVAGCVLFVGGLLIVPLAMRTWIRIDVDGVNVGRLRGSRTFAAGYASVGVLRVPGALVGSANSAVHITGTDGSTVTIALTLFTSSDQRLLVQRLRHTLCDPGQRDATE
jgi:hypothetical protein